MTTKTPTDLETAWKMLDMGPISKELSVTQPAADPITNYETEPVKCPTRDECNTNERLCASTNVWCPNQRNVSLKLVA